MSLHVLSAGLLLLAAPSTTAAGSTSEWPVVELRQYTLHPGQRDVLISLFEAEFVESQEALGMKIVGTFRDLDRPDRFVWIRAFKDMPSRGDALNAFYTGAVWKAHSQAANATMIDASNVLLLRDARPGSSFTLTGAPPAKGETRTETTVIVANIYHFETAVPPSFVQFFDERVRPHLERAGMPVLASFTSETTPNNFPRLPVREDRVFVWLSGFDDQADYERRQAALTSHPDWKPVADAFRIRLKAAPEVLRLQPTSRSRLGHRTTPAYGLEATMRATSGLHDFDFLQGEWRVRHRKLKPGTEEWMEFDGTCSHRLLMAGAANMEEHSLPAPSGAYRAIGLRSYDAKTGEWAIWWLDGRYPSGPLDPPMKGRFDNGTGTFYGDYTQDGKPMRLRFIWSNITTRSARWEQAASTDGGNTWVTNWIMMFERVTTGQG